AGSTVFYLVHSEQISLVSVGDDVMVGDGPAVNQFFGEFAKVAAIYPGGVGPAYVVLDRPTLRGYQGGLICLVPPPHMTDIVVRDLSIGASPTPSDIVCLTELGTRIRFEDVDFVPGPSGGSNLVGWGFNNCGDVSVRDCTTDWFVNFNMCQAVYVDGL